LTVPTLYVLACWSDGSNVAPPVWPTLLVSWMFELSINPADALTGCVGSPPAEPTWTMKPGRRTVCVSGVQEPLRQRDVIVITP
jgi:hypothetical protein